MSFHDEILSIREQISFDESFNLPASFSNIALCGMGGSAIAGMFLSDIYSRVPVSVINDYRIPDWVGPETLFIAMSHSGNTEETISATEKARDRKASILIITSGGSLSSFEGKKIMIPRNLQPRSSIGYMLVPLLRTFGLFDKDIEKDTLAAIDSVLEKKEEIKALAELLVSSKKIPVIYGIPPTPTSAYRWKTQFNENAKILAHSSTIPEMNHNELAAIPHTYRADGFEFFVAGHPEGRYLDRVRITETITKVKFHLLPLFSESVVPQMFASIVYGDLLSFYVAESRKIDPEDVSVLKKLKTSLSGNSQ